MFVHSPYKHGVTMRVGFGVGLGLMLLLVMPLVAFAGIYDADTPTTYKEYWIDHKEFTGGHVEAELPNCVDTDSNGNSWYVEPWGQCRKDLTFTIPDDFSEALKVEVYLDLWRNRVRQSARFQINNGQTYQPLAGENWSRTPYVMAIDKSELNQGQNTLSLFNNNGPFHAHDIAIRIYYDESHPLRDSNGAVIGAPQGELVSVWAENGLFAAATGGTLLVDNDLIVLTANVTTPAKFVEFHAYYDGYDEDNDGVSKDWHNLGRNNFHPGGREEQPTGGTINHIGTLLTPAPGRYTMAWRLPHVINQSGVRFKIRLVDAAGNVQDAAGGISAPFDITRSATVVSYNNPNFDDAVLHHNGEYPDTYATTVSLGANPADFDTAYLIGAFWQNPNISLNGNRTLKAFEDGEDDWALSIRTVTLNWLQSNNNTITYSYTRGFGQFIEKPGPTIVLKQNTAVNDTTPPQLSAVSPAADANSAEPRTAIVLQVADSGLGVDIDTLAMRVDGNTVQPAISGAPDAFTVTYTPTAPLPFDTTVTVAVDGCDYAAQCISGASYNFTVRSPLLVTNVVGSGVITRTPALASYPVGTPVTVTATADPGWTFANWSGTSSGTTPSLGLVLDQDHVITATFAQDQYQIITATDGNGSGSVNVEPAQPTYLYGDVITLTATADPGATFAGWTGAVVGAANPVTITVTGNQAVTATFMANEYALDLTVTGTGTGGVDVAPAQTTYRYNTALTLTATAAPGSTFAGWSGDRTASEPQLNLTITDHLHLTAAFTLDYYTLTVKITDDNDQPAPENRVTVTPAANAAGYVYGEVATLTAVPAPGWLFQGWRDAVEGNQPSTTLTVEGDATVTAVFVPIYYTLTVEAVDDTDAPTTNGAVLISPPQNAAGYRYGELAIVSATSAATGWRFVNWQGVVSSINAVTTFTVTESGVATAHFTDKIYSLTTIISDEAGGTIVAAPAPPYSFGQQITLTVVPTAGWAFVGWSGDLIGTANPATIELNDHKVVTATVERIAYTVQVGVLGGQGTPGGTVTMAPANGPFYYGDRVTLTATPDPGYQFVKWVVEPEMAESVAAAVQGFDPTNPQIEVAVTSSATYLAEFAATGPLDRSVFLPIVVTE